MQESISKLPIFLISLKFEKSLFLSIVISEIGIKFSFTGQEHFTFFVKELYSVKSQPSSHIVKLLFL